MRKNIKTLGILGLLTVATIINSNVTTVKAQTKNEEIKLTAGAASVLDSVNTSYVDENTFKIRCTGYCDYGYTKSGEYVRQGVLAGKEEWLGKGAKLYKVNEDGTKGNLIGHYQFLDTGYGINGSIVDGTSIDVWHSNEESVWEWASTYGDYVYIEIL